MMKRPSCLWSLAFKVVAVVTFSVLVVVSSASGLGSGEALHKIHQKYPNVLDPLKISYDNLVLQQDQGDDDLSSIAFLLQQELSHVGLISITDIPQFKLLKEQLLSWELLHQCTLESQHVSSQAHQYDDGTIRRSLATRNGMQDVEVPSDSIHCREFQQAATAFRQIVEEVTTIFASRLSTIVKQYQIDPSEPLLLRQDDGSLPSLDTVLDIVQQGEHLEHFHSYQKLTTVDQQSSTSATATTIGLHTDQGLFLVFTPGRIVQQQQQQQQLQHQTSPSHDGASPGTMSRGFVIELSDGSHAEVEFDANDDLVIMLGDGVYQYINPKLSQDYKLRAVPHQLSLPSTPSASETQQETTRVWYGRMVLPPPNAMHPQHTSMTFGQVRHAMIEASLTSSSASADSSRNAVMTMGCSLPTLIARQLEITACQANEMFCWHECQSLSDFNVSDSICQASGRKLLCLDPENDVVWDGSDHGNYVPGCGTANTNTTTNATTQEPNNGDGGGGAGVTTTTPSPTAAPPTKSEVQSLWSSHGRVLFLALIGTTIFVPGM